jgi:hypothetical protein
VLDKNKLSYFNEEKLQLTQFFLKQDSAKLEKIVFFDKDNKKEIGISNNGFSEKEQFSSPDFLKKQEENFLEVKNFFYLTFFDLYPLIQKKDSLFFYIFCQKIADMLVPIFLFFIFLGRPLSPRNTDLERKMIFRSSFCILFLLTSQIGIFLFKANGNYPFIYAFFSHIFWGVFIVIRFIKNEKY